MEIEVSERGFRQRADRERGGVAGQGCRRRWRAGRRHGIGWTWHGKVYQEEEEGEQQQRTHCTMETGVLMNCVHTKTRCQHSLPLAGQPHPSRQLLLTKVFWARAVAAAERAARRVKAFMV